MVQRCSRRPSLMVWAAVASLLAAVPGQAASPRQACPSIGAVYAAHGADSADSTTYRLTIEALPKADADVAFATLWRFQVLDRHTGAKLSELRMQYSCANGQGSCSVAPPGRPGADGGYGSQVVQLNKDFTLATGDQAPYAIVLPGFGQDNWTFSRADMKMPDLTLFTPAKVTPDMQNRQVWLLTACGPQRPAG